MNRNRVRRWYPRLTQLEDRLAPAGVVSLITDAEPSLYAESGGGLSFVSTDPAVGSSPHARTVSDDGRYVAFASNSSNLLFGQVDTNGTYDVFLYDRIADNTQLVSRRYDSALSTGDGVSSLPVISGDGRYIAFRSEARDLMAGMIALAGSRSNIFIYDRTTETSKLVSHAVGDSLVGSSFDDDGGSSFNISQNGQVIVFRSQATNLTAGFPNPSGSISATFAHAYTYDVATAQVTLIDKAFGSATAPGNRSTTPGSLTPDGRFILVNSESSNLLATATTISKGNVFRYDRQTGDLLLLTQNNGTTPLGANASSFGAAISPDGRWVLIQSAATNLAGGATVTGHQIYMCDTQSNSLTLMSHQPGNPLMGGDGDSEVASMTPDGRYVAFRSEANNLVANFVDGNSASMGDVYLYDRLSNQATLVSAKNGAVATSGNGGSGGSWIPRISNDGRDVIFSDLSTDLVPGFVDRNVSFAHDLFRFDRFTNSISLLSGQNGSASIGSGGDYNNPADNGFASINFDATVVVWVSKAPDLSAAVKDTNGHEDVYVRDFVSGTTKLASRRFGTPSASAGGFSEWVRQSADGRFVVFSSSAGNLVLGQVESLVTQDVFLLDRVAGTTVLVSHAVGSLTTAANEPSNRPVISADGRYIAYCSTATNLIAGFIDINATTFRESTDVYLYDRLTGVNTLVSHQFDNFLTSGNEYSGAVNNYFDLLLSISENGRFVSYATAASNLVSGFVNNNSGWPDVLVYDRLTGTNQLINHEPGLPTSGGNERAYQPKLSADGRFVAYWSTATNLITGMAGGGRNVYLYDRQTQDTVLVSHSSASFTTSGNAGSNEAAISADGRFVVFQSASNNLIAGQVDTNNLDDVFMYDRMTGQNVLVSHTHDSLTTAGDITSSPFTNNQNDARVITADGRYVVYKSGASNIVSGFVDNNGQDGTGSTSTDVYLYDRVTGVNTLISHSFNSATASGNGQSTSAQISGDGRFIAIGTRASDLAPGWIFPTFGFDQVALFDRFAGTFSLVSHSTAGKHVAGDSDSMHSVLSADGSTVSFWSRATDHVANDFNVFSDVFSYVQLPPTVLSVQFNDGSDQRSMVKQLVVTFSEPVSFMGSIASAFTLHRQGSVGDVTLSASPASGWMSSVTITFSSSFTESGGSLIDGRYDLLIDAAQVSGVGGALDGNSDGIAGGSYVINGTAANKFYRLFGDSDGDGTVSQISDFAALATAIGNPSSIFDFDNDDVVSTFDMIQFRNRFGTVI